MPSVAGDVAAATDLATVSATAIELEVQVGASPQLCDRCCARRPIYGAMELPMPRMNRKDSIQDVGGGGGWGIEHNNKRMADTDGEKKHKYCLSDSGDARAITSSALNNQPPNQFEGFLDGLLSSSEGAIHYKYTTIN